MDTAEITIALGTIVVFGVGAQWLGRRSGIPSIVLLLLAGIIAGPVTGLVDPEALLGDTLDPAITLAVGLLLFDSGLTLRLSEFTRGRAVVSQLVTTGLLITWLVGSVAAYFIFDLSAEVAVLLGAVLVVSGPTVVGPILKAARPERTTGNILEWEGATLDPIGATLGIVVLTAITADPQMPLLGGLGLTLITAVTGIAIGLACAGLLILSIRNFAMPDDLNVPVAFMFAVLAFSVSNVLFAEAGLFATLAMGLALANQEFAYVTRIRRFQAGIGSLVIATLFIVLAATIDLDELRSVLLPSAALLGVLVLVARPLAAFASTIRSGLNTADRGFIASVAPRGIVAASTVSFYAITLAENEMAADEIVPITFAIIIGAGIVYGFGSPAMANLLGVGQGTAKGVAFFTNQDDVHPIANKLADAGVPVLVVDDVQRATLVKADLSYRLLNGDAESEGMAAVLLDNNIGTAVMATGLRARDLVSMSIIATDIGRKNVFFVPRVEKGEETGIEARLRAKTPDKRIAFGPDVTREKLRSAQNGQADLLWLPAGTDGSQAWAGTRPLFIVEADGRCIVANQLAIGKLEAKGSDPQTRVLCLRPRQDGTESAADSADGS